MSEKLCNPPIVEAICEFRFDPESEWDWTIPGQLSERIKSDFPDRSQTIEQTVHLHSEGNEPCTVIAPPMPSRIQLKKADESAMVQVGPHLLAVNHLQPYQSWECFLEMILGVLREYCEITKALPPHRMGLRYINRILVPTESFEVEDYITLKPSLSGTLDRNMSKFYQRYELSHDSPEGSLIHQTGIRKVNDELFLMVDLDFGSQEVNELDTLAKIKRWLNDAHERILEAFVDSLNPELYQKFKKGNE